MSRFQSRMFRVFAPFAVLAVVSFGIVAFAGNGKANSPHATMHAENSDSGIAFRNDMRKLWEDHITWTRLAVISLADGLPDQDATVNRLFQNQVDIGNAIKPYYGDAAGTQLTSLLHDHIAIAAQLILDAKAGNGPAVNADSANWTANADAIAAFLNGANPDRWGLQEMTVMMHDHLALTLVEAQARLGHNYSADVAAYDQVHTQILGMADMLSMGIIDQFPNRFK